MPPIMIIGGPGPGKSTRARSLGQKPGLPVVHLDPLFWEPGWGQREPAQIQAQIQALIAAAAAPTRGYLKATPLAVMPVAPTGPI